MHNLFARYSRHNSKSNQHSNCFRWIACLFVLAATLINAPTAKADLAGLVTDIRLITTGNNTLSKIEVDVLLDYYPPATTDSFEFQLSSAPVFWDGSLNDFDIAFEMNVSLLSAPGAVPIGAVAVDLLSGPNTPSTDSDWFFIETTPEPFDANGHFSEPPTFTFNGRGEAESALWETGMLEPGETSSLQFLLNFEGNANNFFPIDSAFRVTVHPNAVPEPGVLALTPLLALFGFKRKRSIQPNQY